MNEIVTQPAGAAIMEQVLIKGDLSKLSPAERNTYYMETCASLGMNPLTRPFEYITLNGRLQLYALRTAADQLRKINGVNIRIIDQRTEGNMYLVTVEATDRTGRVDTDMGAVTMPQGLAGDNKANAILKCITKAKRRVTLSICGLGFLDETEVEDIPATAKIKHPPTPAITATPPAGLDAVTPSTASTDGAAHQGFSPSTDEAALSRDGWDDTLIQMDDALADAAIRGMTALKAEWKITHKTYQKRLEPRLRAIHQPVAMEAGE